jgi:uncharacterized protein (UPF0332 family)
VPDRLIATHSRTIPLGLRYRAASLLSPLGEPEMNNSVSVQTLLAKAEKALDRARIVMAFQDIDRGYHNIYKALTLSAHAALLATSPSSNVKDIRTYNDLLSAFYSHLMAPGLVPPELAHILRTVQDIRLDADTNGTSVSSADAQFMFKNAERFIDAMRALVTQ